MSKLVNATRQNDSLTKNGAVTHSTSLNNCLDFFYLAGASRRMSEKDIITMFEQARAESKTLAYKILFWARDCRGGAGEKRLFQIISKHCYTVHPNEYKQVAMWIPEYGYWKDIFKIEEPTEYLLERLDNRLKQDDNLLAKWFPRKGKWFTAMHKHLKITPKELRKKLVNLTNVVETRMCNKEWDKVIYNNVPSVAMNMYRNAFMKHDTTRFTEFNESVISGKSKVNASVLHPHMLFQAFERGEDTNAIKAQWMNLIDYMKDTTERILPVCDVSGSMTGLPMDVSVSLGVYISERNKGIFKDAFITFSTKPQMLYLKGDIIDRFRQLHRAPWGGSTNIAGVFELILQSALDNKLKQIDMPTKILIISDMEFNSCASNTNLQNIQNLYTQAGYKMPTVVFWNVNGRIGNVPASSKDKNIGLVSGFSPAILTSILGGKSFTPHSLMMEAITQDRYLAIDVK